MTKHVRNVPIVVAAIMLLSMGVIAVAFSGIPEGKPRPGPWFPAAMIGLILGSAMAIVILRDRAKVRPPGNDRWGLRFWGLLFAVQVLFFYAMVPARMHLEAGSWAGVLLVGKGFGIYFALVGVVGFVAFMYNRLRGRNLRAILEREREGDAYGAIKALRAEIAVRGPTAERLNLLGYFLMRRGRWEESDEQFREAIRLKGRRFPQLANHAVATWKLGRAEEAAAIYDEMEALAPLEGISACNYCQILADLGRLDEARERLEHAEREAKAMIRPRARDRIVLEQQIQECRDRLAGKKDFSGLAEI